MRTRYEFGGTVENNAVGVGFWTRDTLPRRSDDIYVILDERTALRPNLITHRVYGRDNLVWLLLQYNNILDPVAELVPGKQLALPHPTRIS